MVASPLYLGNLFLKQGHRRRFSYLLCSLTFGSALCNAMGMKMEDFIKYFSPTYWSAVFSKKSRIAFLCAKYSRISIAASRGFNYDDCATKASALTFYSLLSIVPVLAIAFGIAKGFGFEAHLEQDLKDKFIEQHDVADKLFEFAHQMLQSSQSGVVAGVGIVVLLWTVVKLLGSIESSFNAIWKIKQPRSFSRKFSDYLALIIFCPLFFAASSSISVFVMTNIIVLSKSSEVWSLLHPMITFSFHFFPILFSWMLFTALYYIMPNAKVPFRYALIAGLVAAATYQVVQWTYIRFQFSLTSYSAIYGSFAALPLFLIWLNTSWLITLAGAEIAYHAEIDWTRRALHSGSKQHQVDGRILGLLIMNQCIQAFRKGEMPPTEYILSEQLGVPAVEVRKVLQDFLEAGLLVQVTWKDGELHHFQPGRSLESITIKSICDLLNASRQIKYPVLHQPDVDRFEKILEEFDRILLEAQEKNASLRI